MVAARIGPDMRMAAVAAPSYFAGHAPPVAPHDLAQHSCINLRFPTYGGRYAWKFEREGRALNVRVEGQLIVNDIVVARQAARDGDGLAYLPEDYLRPDLDSGRLTRVLEDWCPAFPGYHLYCTSRRQLSPAFKPIELWLCSSIRTFAGAARTSAYGWWAEGAFDPLRTCLACSKIVSRGGRCYSLW